MVPTTSITRPIAEAILYCDLKAHLLVTAKRGSCSAYMRLQRQLVRSYRKRAGMHLRGRHDRGNAVFAPECIKEAISRGSTLLLQPTLNTGVFRFELDAVVAKLDSKGECHDLLPVLYVHAERPTANDKLLLAVTALLLQRATGRIIERGMLVHGHNLRSSTVSLEKIKERAAATVHQLESLIDNDAPSIFLNSHCRHCQFEARCSKAAEESDDLSLLRGISRKEVERLNERGIFSVTQYSFTYKTRRHAAKSKHDRALNAMAMRNDSIYVRHVPELPDTTTRVFLDIEGLPHRDFYYLLGVTIVKGPSRNTFSLWADDCDSEYTLWSGLIEALTGLDDFTVFHYGDYDKRAMSRLRLRYGTADATTLTNFNVLSAIYGCVYFPCYSNDLKSVAGTLGFRWDSPNAGGLDSVVWRHEWETERAESMKRRLIRYNQDDVMALECVVDALYKIQSEEDASLPKPTVSLDDVKSEHGYNLIRDTATVPEIELINRRSYFDYQRHKVRIRHDVTTNQGKKRTRAKKCPARVDRVIQLDPPKECPECGADALYRHGPLQTVVHDLSFTKTGVKRANLRYKSSRFRCRQCGKAFTPAGFRSQSKRKYGHNLISWATYNHIDLKQSGGSVVEGLRTIFGYSFDRRLTNRLKRRAAEFYSPAYEMLKDAIKCSDVVYADETPVKIRKGRGYVWVFATHRTVFYMYSDTRDASVLEPLLGDFSGVLVSDFYAAYDVLPCEKQKCLIHLFRDLNDALVRNPFDDEIKSLTLSLTSLMIPIVETIDRFGLRKRYLKKHRKEAGQFIERIQSRRFTSPDAGTLVSRMLAHSHSLFTFLEHDNVAWSNNNAEHAVKRFAMLRNTIGNVSTAGGIQQYLVLLSLCESLRRRDTSFLEFLLSQSIDVDRWA